MRSEALKVHRNWPRIRCAFNEVIHLRLHSVPRAVTVDIVEEGVLAGLLWVRGTGEHVQHVQHMQHVQHVQQGVLPGLLNWGWGIIRFKDKT
eukprot:936105-Amorphochlora_amoeboformis.AAC.1